LWIRSDPQVRHTLVEVDAAPRGCAVLLVVADDFFGPALGELVSLARRERDVQQLEARRGDLRIAAPGQQAAAAKAQEELVEGSDGQQREDEPRQREGDGDSHVFHANSHESHTIGVAS
jgi:hypothetical protein